MVEQNVAIGTMEIHPDFDFGEGDIVEYTYESPFGTKLSGKNGSLTRQMLIQKRTRKGITSDGGYPTYAPFECADWHKGQNVRHVMVARRIGKEIGCYEWDRFETPGPWIQAENGTMSGVIG